MCSVLTAKYFYYIFCVGAEIEKNLKSTYKFPCFMHMLRNCLLEKYIFWFFSPDTELHILYFVCKLGSIILLRFTTYISYR